MRRNYLVVGLKLAAALLAAGSLALLSALLKAPVLATVLKLQALAVTAMTISNLGAIPYVAHQYATSGPQRYGVLCGWLRRRCSVAAVVGIILTLTAGVGASPAERLAFCACAALWACAYAYELTDVALLSDENAVFAGASSVAVVAIGFMLKVAAALWLPRVDLLLAISVGETAARFGWQLARLQGDAREQQLSASSATGGLLADLPVMASSIVNAGAARVDQYVATRWLDDGEAATYLLCCRFFDAVWLLPFTILNLALVRGPGGHRKPGAFRQVVGAVALAIVALMCVAIYIAAVNVHYRDAIAVMALLAPTLLTLMHHAVAWRWEAEGNDTRSGFLRSVIQLLVIVVLIAGVTAAGPMTAIVLACAIAVARLGGVALSLVIVQSFRTHTAQILSRRRTA